MLKDSLDIEFIKHKVGNCLFLLYVLIIVVDPANIFTHLKDVSFALLVAYNILFYKIYYKYAMFFVLLCCPVVFGFLMAQIQMNPIGQDEMIGALKSVAPFILLLWVKEYDVVRLSIIPSFVGAVCLIVLYLVVVFVDGAEYIVWMFSEAHNKVFLLTTRYFYGIKFFGIYINSIYCLSFCMFLMYYRIFDSRRWYLYAVGAIILSFPFFCGGTRSVMLMPIAFFGIVVYGYFSKKRYAKYFSYPIMISFAIMFLFVIYMLATEEGQTSNDMKYAHLTSYMNLFREHPEYLVLGQGPGTSFYTSGFGRMTTQTEWSYIEIVRNYGISSIIILFIFIYPVIKLFKYRKDNYYLGVLVVCVIYLFIAGTNPLLMTSTGSFVLLCAYSELNKAESVED